MKILKLQFKNINSLRGEWEIDFTQPPFLNQGLFAITGPTGSGKSTLLDIITLSLYNYIARLGKVSNAEILKQGAIITRGQKEAYASVTYRCKQGEFVSTWRIETNRNGNLKDYEMELARVDTGEIITTKKSIVPDENAARIGLHFNQFEKSILLAQGEFSKFLNVDKKERSAILEKITGRDIYRKLGIKAFEKVKEIHKAVDQIQAKIEDRQQDLLPEDTIVEHEKSIAQNLHTRKINEQRIRELEKKLENHHHLKQAIKTEEGLQQGMFQLEKEIQQFNNHQGQKLRNHLATAPWHDKLHHWVRRKSELQNTSHRIIQLTKERDQLNTIKENLLHNIQNQISIVSSESKIIDDLEDFEQKVQKLNLELERTRTQFSAIYNEIKALAHPLPITLTHDIPILKAKSNQLLTQIIEKIKNYNSTFQFDKVKNIESFLQVIQSDREKLSEARIQAKDILQLTEKIEEQHQLITEKSSQLQRLPEEISQAKEVVDRARNEYTILQLEEENRKLQAELATHRQALVENQPCPLCGALHHPYVNHYTKKKDHSEKLQNMESQLASLQANLSILTNREKEFQLQIEKLKQELKSNQLKKEQQEKFFTESYTWPILSNWEVLGQQYKSKIEALVEYQKLLSHEEILHTILPKIDQLEKINHRGQSMKLELQTVYSDSIQELFDLIKTFKTQWNETSLSMTKTTQSLNEVQIHIQSMEQEVYQLESKLSKEISEHLNQSLDWAQSTILPFEEFNALQQEEKRLNDHGIRLSKELEQTQENIATYKKNLGSDDESTLSQHLDLLEKEQQSVQSTIEELNRQLTNQKATEKLIADLEKERKKILADNHIWMLLKTLIGDASGNKFNDYAQELTLLQLISMANHRLSSLNQRYLLANPRDEEDDSLTIIDQDMGGQRRSIKTLSGGETFIISLALALALSDLASQNVRIDSMFIDEGFGTLDPETLDQVLDSIERLQQSGSKMIGIISHVSTLKERIVTQIQLEQNGQGFSKIKIV